MPRCRLSNVPTRSLSWVTCRNSEELTNGEGAHSRLALSCGVLRCLAGCWNLGKLLAEALDAGDLVLVSHSALCSR